MAESLPVDRKKSVLNQCQDTNVDLLLRGEVRLDLSSAAIKLLDMGSESHFLEPLKKFPANRLCAGCRAVYWQNTRVIDIKNFIFAADNPKHTNLPSVSHWMGSKEKYFGQKILLQALVDEKQKLALPLTFKFCQPKKAEGQIKATKLVVGLIKKTLKLGVPACLWQPVPGLVQKSLRLT